MPKKNKIYIKQWLNIKPYQKQVKTDFYYLNLCNKVKDVLTIVNNDINVIDLFDEDIDLISCLLVSYFEDIISQTNIWPTFVRLHDKMYGKKLPFYDTSEYFANEINEQDIIFLLWYFIYIFTEEIEDEPFNKYSIIAASKVMKIFDEEYGSAPENEELKQIYSIDEAETDYYEVRKFIDKIAFNTYLFFPDTGMELISQIEGIIEKNEGESENYLMGMMNDWRDSYLFKLNTKLLSLKSFEWAAEILGEEHALFNDLKNIGNKFNSYFINKSEDDKDIILEHISTSREFRVTKKSINEPERFKEKDTVVIMGLANWMGEWWFSGMLAVMSKKDSIKVIEDKKTAEESIRDLPYTNKEKENAKTFLLEQEEAFLKFNNEKYIAFVKEGELNNFIEDYTNFFNKSKGRPEKGKSGRSKKSMDFKDSGEGAVVFFNPKSGVEIAFVNNAFTAKENKYFDEYESAEETYHLLYSKETSAELANYCIDNYKDKLGFFKTDFGKIFLENSDFLLRFWKGSSYHSKPEISFV